MGYVQVNKRCIYLNNKYRDTYREILGAEVLGDVFISITTISNIIERYFLSKYPFKHDRPNKQDNNIWVNKRHR